MNNTVLRLLKIFEEETDENNMLTKNEILDILVLEGYESINEKQFYRKIEELRNNGYNIEIKKGRQTRYFMKKDRLSREEWIFLITLILNNKDLSSRETNHMIKSLENMNVSYKSLDYAEPYIEKFKEKVEKSPVNCLKNFKVILEAIDKKKDIEYNEYNVVDGKNIISTRESMTPKSFTLEDNGILIMGKKDNLDLNIKLSKIIDVEIKEK